MELNQDWRRYQDTFFPARKGPSGESRPIYVVEEKGVARTVFSEGEDLSQWSGSSLPEIRAQFTHRPVVSVSRSGLDQWVQEALVESHLPNQVSLVRDRWISNAGSGAPSRASDELSRSLPARGHFLFEAIEDSWWARLLPSAFGVVIRLEGEAGIARDFMLVYRRGRLEQFGEPDLQHLSQEARGQFHEVCRSLSERALVPVQGVILGEQDWRGWSEQAHPWKEIAWALQSKRVQLVPYRWSWVGLIATRGFIGI